MSELLNIFALINAMKATLTESEIPDISGMIKSIDYYFDVLPYFDCHTSRISELLEDLDESIYEICTDIDQAVSFIEEIDDEFKLIIGDINGEGGI